MSLNADSSVCAVESFVESCVENHEFKAIGRLYSHVNILIITEPITKIGRNSSSQKHLHFAIDNSKYVSREHFEIHLIDHDFYMICKSRNGIYLDGVLMRASPEPVKLPPDTCAFRIPSTNIELVFNNWLNGIPKEDNTHPSSEVVNIESNWPKIEKPPYSYAQLIVQAIQSAPKKQLSLSAIYSFISRKYSYFRDDDSKGWQNSIRHNLSLNRYFLKIPRSSDTPGKGCLWRIDPKCEMKLAANCYRKRKNRLNTIGERNVSSTDPYTPKVSPSHVNLLVNFMENNTINNLTLNNSMLEKRDISFN